MLGENNEGSSRPEEHVISTRVPAACEERSVTAAACPTGLRRQHLKTKAPLSVPNNEPLSWNSVLPPDVHLFGSSSSVLQLLLQPLDLRVLVLELLLQSLPVRLLQPVRGRRGSSGRLLLLHLLIFLVQLSLHGAVCPVDLLLDSSQLRLLCELH